MEQPTAAPLTAEPPPAPAPPVPAPPAPDPKESGSTGWRREFLVFVSGGILALISTMVSSWFHRSLTLSDAYTLVREEIRSHLNLEPERLEVYRKSLAVLGDKAPRIEPVDSEALKGMELDPSVNEISIPYYPDAIYREIRHDLAIGDAELRWAIIGYYTALARAKNYADLALAEAPATLAGELHATVRNHRRRLLAWNRAVLLSLIEAGEFRAKILARLG